mgnify:CR=1 FL=1
MRHGGQRSRRYMRRERERALQKRMLTRGKVWLDEGWIFGEGGAGFERIVLACPRSILKEAVDRMARAFE